MAHTTPISKKNLLAAAAGFICGTAALAQSLPTVSVSGRSADTPAHVGGFGEVPVAKLPMQLSLISNERLLDAGINALSGLTALDASVGDAYNSTGYVSYLKIRGFDLDNRFNYRRDGLPINAETALALGNKASVEILKGSSGIQAGTSSPGGLLNMLVKRPAAQPLTVLSFALSERGTAEASLDWSQRFGDTQAFGLRINAAATEMKPQLRDANGRSHLLAMAGDWRISPDTLIEAEFELNKQSQPSQPGMSMLGDKLPDAQDFDPRLNLNNQHWSQPVVFDNSHASLRVTQKLAADWFAQAHLGTQGLKTDDRLAFAFGCTAADGGYYADRYCPDGTFDMYDYRSENERRNSNALDLSMTGKLSAGGISHQLSTGVLFSRFDSRFQKQAYNSAGTGTIDGKSITSANPGLNYDNTNRDERSTEFYLRDAMQLGAAWQAWAGLRHTQLTRESINTSGQEGTNYSQTLTTPWLGLSYALSDQHMLYASWGQGMESEVTPNRPEEFQNPGQALPARKSEQIELGIKAGSKTVDWSVNWFEIENPVWSTIDKLRQADGIARHQGLEAQADLKWAGGGLLASAMQLKARREDRVDASMNGLRPVNVAERSLRLHARQDIPGLTGLQLQAGLVYEGPRMVLADNSVSIPGWTRLDAGARFEQALGRQLLVWRLGVDNLADKRAWKESPFQFGHVYLYPLAPRTFRASIEFHL